MWNRRDWGRVCASALLTAGLPAARTETVPAAPPTVRAPLGRVVIAVDHKASFCYLPLTVAERLGYFAAEGLDVQVHDHGESDKALQALLSGAAQVLSGAYSNAINQQLQGQGLRCFVLQGRTPQLVLGVSQRSLPRFRDLGDLRGRRVAVPALGSASHRMARLMFERAGLKPLEVDYQVFSGPSATLAAFRTGQVEALCYHDPVITQLEQSGELRVVVDTRTLRGNAEVFGGPMPAGGLMAADRFLDAYPRQAQALTHAMVHALNWLQTAGPSDLNRTVPEQYFQGDRALYLAAFQRARESWVPDGLMPEAGPQTAMRMLAHFGDEQQLRRVQLEQTFTNRLAAVAKARFRV